jgi:NDP-sugar pyrophosphorylase family protein
MRAMIFAAGLGTRLRPLTDHRPKALVEVGGISLLEINIRRLIKLGVTDIIINVHHFADQIETFIAEKKAFGINIAFSDEREKLLDTGGGLKKAAWFFEKYKEPFLVCNADVLSNIDLQSLINYHVNQKVIATYAVQRRETSRYMLHDANMQLYGWANIKSGDIKISRQARQQALKMYAFSTYQVLNPKIFKLMPEEEVFSMIDLYLKVARKQPVLGWLHENDIWIDVGKPQAIEMAAGLLNQLINT